MESHNFTTPEASSRAPTADYREIFDAVHDAILIHDVQTGAILDANRKMYEMFGYSPEEARHLDITALCGYGPTCTHEFIRQLIAQAAAGAPQLFEWQVKDRSGRVFWVEVHLKHAVLDGRARMLAVIRDITERKAGAQALKESEALYRMVTEGSLAGVYLGTENGFLYVNQPFAQIFGYRPEDLMRGPVNPEDLVHPEDLPLVQENVRRRLTGEQEAVHYIFRGRRQDGTVIYCETMGRRVEYQGRPAIIGTLLDITAQQRAAEALRESDARYRLVTEGSLAGVYIGGGDTFLYVNPTLAHIFGYQPDEIIGRLGPPDLTHPDDRPMVIENIRKRLAGEPGYQKNYILRGLRKDGTEILCEILSSHGQYLGKPAIYGTLLDITAQQRAAEALRESEGTLRAILDANPESIFLVDAQGTILAANATMARRLGKTVDEVLGACIFDLIPPEVARRRKAYNEQVLATGRPVRFEDTRAGIQFDVHIYPIPDEAGKVTGVAVLEIDITERKRAEEAMRASEASYRTLVEQIPAVTYTAALDNVTTHLYISPQIEAALGFSPEEWLADPETYQSRIHPEDRNRVLSELLLSYAEEGPFLAEYRLLSKDGRVVWVRDESRAVHDLHGRPLFLQGVLLDITARRQTEENLRAVNEQLRALIDASPLAITCINPDGKVTLWNPAATSIFYWCQEEALGRPLPFVPAAKQEECREIRRYVLKGATIRGMEVRRLRRDGTPVDISLSAAPLHDAAGNTTGVLSVITDVTERKRFEAALIQSEARFRAIFEGAAVGILRTDLQGQVQESNAALRRMLGYRSGELSRLTIADLTHPDDLAMDLRLFTELAAGNRDSYQLEKRYVCKDGRWVWARLTVSLVRNAAGEPQFAIRMVEDITERKKAEAALKESEEKYRALMDAASDAILLSDTQGRLLEANRRAEELLGYTKAELLQMHYRQLHPQETLDSVVRAFQEIVGKGSGSLHDGVVLTKDGKRVPVDITGSAIEYAGKKIAQGIFRDITQRKKTEEALRESERQLRLLASQLLTIQERERRRVSRELHDELGQALTVLKMHLVGIENQLGPGQEALKANCEQLLTHIDGVIENVRRLSWDLSPTILEDLGLSSSLRYLIDDICRNNNIKGAVKMGHIDHLFSQETQINIYRLFQEALTNIVRHARATRVSVTIKRKKGAVSFELTDDGLGFEVAQVMSRHDSPRHLGLTTMQERARLMNGTFSIESQKGRGTTISLTIPIEK